MAQDWLAEVRRGGDPGGAKDEVRKAPTMAELCTKFMEDYSNKRNKPSTPEGYQGVIHRCIIPLLGRKKVQDVKRPDIAGLMEKLSYKATEANTAFGVLRKMFNLAEVWGYRPDGTNACRHVPMFPPLKETQIIVDGELAHATGSGLRERLQRRLGVRLQPLGGTKARLKSHRVLLGL